MKVEETKPYPHYHPITITLENQFEFDALYYLLSTPEHVCFNHKDAMKLRSDLSDALRKIQIKQG